MSELSRYREFLYGAQDPSRPTIFIAGGSNALFGINGEIIEKATGYNVRNYALHASLSLELGISQIVQHVHNGDILVLSHEFQVFDRAVGTEFDATNYFRHLQYAGAHPTIPDLAKLYTAVPLERWWSGLINYVVRPVEEQPFPVEHSLKNILWDARGPQSASATEFYGVHHVTPSGSYAVDAPMTKWTWIHQGSMYTEGSLSKSSIDRRKAVVREMNKLGVRVLLVAPVLFELRDKAVRMPQFWASMEGIRLSLLKDGLPLSCDPMDGVLSSLYRLDTYFHANKTGAAIRSVKLARCLERFIMGENVETQPINASEDAALAARILDDQTRGFGQGDVHVQRMLRSLNNLNEQVLSFKKKYNHYPTSDFFNGKVDKLEVGADEIVYSSTPSNHYFPDGYYYVGAKPGVLTSEECTVVSAFWPKMIVRTDLHSKDLTDCAGYGFGDPFPDNHIVLVPPAG